MKCIVQDMFSVETTKIWKSCIYAIVAMVTQRIPETTVSYLGFELHNKNSVPVKTVTEKMCLYLIFAILNLMCYTET